LTRVAKALDKDSLYLTKIAKKEQISSGEYNWFIIICMNDDTSIWDLKQFIAATVSQQTGGYTMILETFEVISVMQ